MKNSKNSENTNDFSTVQSVLLVMLSAVIILLLYIQTAFYFKTDTSEVEIPMYWAVNSYILPVGNDDIYASISAENVNFEGDYLKPVTLERQNSTEFGEEILSDYGILVDLENNEIISQRMENTKCYPASLTKIMTAFTALTLCEQNNISLDETVIMPEEIFPLLNSQNASMAGFLPGEEVKLIDLLYGALLPSGADATMGLAIYFCGGDGINPVVAEESFAEIMTNLAIQCGAENTNFVNSHGLQDENHYSTTYDIAVILTKALENDTFRKIFCERDVYTCSPTAKDIERQGIHSFIGTFWHRKFGTEDPSFTIIGAKTGFTNEAGGCLATLTVKDGKEYIAITCHNTTGTHLNEVYSVYKYIDRPEGPENANS